MLMFKVPQFCIVILHPLSLNFIYIAKFRIAAQPRQPSVSAFYQTSSQTLEETTEICVLYTLKFLWPCTDNDEIFLLESSDSRELRLTVPRSDAKDKKKQEPKPDDAAGE